MNASAETLRRERIDAVQELAATHLSAAQRPLVEGFAREYFRQLDTDDLAERTPEDLCGAAGSVTTIRSRNEAPQAARESWMHIEVDRLVDPQQRSELVAGIERVLGDVRAAVEDWQAMLARLHEATAELVAMPASLPPALVAESHAFLEWLADNHLTLLGYRQHDLVTEQGQDALR